MKNEPGDLFPTTPPEPPGPKERQLLEACLRALREQAPVECREHPAENVLGARDHLQLDVGLDGRTIPFTIEVKQALRAAHIGAIAHRARQLKQRGMHLLLCADRIPDELGAELRRHGVAYIDRGGNAWIQAPGIFVLITGRRPVGQPRRRRHLRGTEVRLLGVFLIDPRAGGAVQATLAQHAGIALGAVGPGRETLMRLGILDCTGKRRWRVRDREEGLLRFAEGWAAFLRPKLDPKTYRLLAAEQRGELEERLRLAGPDLECLLGGERAAAHLTQHLQTDQTTLHVPVGRRKEVMTALALVPDDQGHVTLLDRYGLGDEYHIPDLPRVALAQPLLVWAECLTVPDERVAQSAAQLHEKLLQVDDE